MKLPLARDGFRFILPTAGVAVVMALLGWWPWAGILAAAALFLCFFFRDFERTTPGIENAVFAAGDGVVDDIEEVELADFPGGKAIKIGVFLSVFNCHVTRSPTGGRIEKVLYHPGKFINAMNRRSSSVNENNCVLLDRKGAPVLVKQIAGAIARRIVCTAREGHKVAAGQRLGLIRMGSRVEVYVPTDAKLRTTLGAKTRAGESVLAVLSPPNAASQGEQPTSDPKP